MKGSVEPAALPGRAATRDWFVDSGAERLAKTSNVSYDEYARRAREQRALPATFDDDRLQIELDLDRILPSLQEFRLLEGGDDGRSGDQSDLAMQSEAYGTLVGKLRSVLMASSVRNARVGYVQGHADLLCFVLAHTPTRHDEEQAFWIYSTILERIFPEDFFARSPKLHGFHVDVKVFEDLITQRLVPHVPQLGNVDVGFLASLLACKWFIPVWVGELPNLLLCEVWEAMLCEDDGTFLHLMLAIHFVRIACDSLVAKGQGAQWEASYVYKEVLEVCRGMAPTISLSTLRQEARVVYSLSDEGVEDWRANLRGHSPFLGSETRALLQTVHFQPTEIARLHGEFMFARSFRKRCERLRLRGVRDEFVDGLLAREFPMIPSEVSRRVVDLLRRDAYGNISFYRLTQLLSVLHRGNQEERAMLLFSAADKSRSLCLDRTGVEELADLLCSLAVHQLLHGSSNETDCTLEYLRVRRPEHSPLMRAHFVSLVEVMQGAKSGCLSHDMWLEGIPNCPDICAVLAEWEMLVSEGRKLNQSPGRGVHTLLRRSGSSSALSTLAQTISLTRTTREKTAISFRKTKRLSVDTNKRRSSSTDDPAIVATSLSGSPQLSLLAGRMRKKYQKQCKTQQTSRRIGPRETSSSLEVSTHPSDRVFWCECIVS